MKNKNKYRVIQPIGKGQIESDPFEQIVEINGAEYKIGDLLDLIVNLQDQLNKLENKIAAQNDAQAKTDTLISNSIDILSKQVARLNIRNK